MQCEDKIHCKNENIHNYSVFYSFFFPDDFKPFTYFKNMGLSNLAGYIKCTKKLGFQVEKMKAALDRKQRKLWNLKKK